MLKTLSGKLLRLASNTDSRNALQPPEPCPFDVKKLNDSVYEFYKPSRDPKLAVIFFHGLPLDEHAKSYWSTWRSADNKELWPQQTWLAEEYLEAHILSLSYDTSSTAMSEHLQGDLQSIGSNLIQSLIMLKKAGCPIVMIGHSFGGIVMKQLCVQAHNEMSTSPEADRIERVLANIKGLFFYATPHHGIAARLVQSGIFGKGPLLEYMKLFSTASSRNNEAFSKLCQKRKWESAALGEGYATVARTFTEVIVPEGSAREGEYFRLVTSDYLNICKPESTTSSTFLSLTMFIQDCAGIGIAKH